MAIVFSNGIGIAIANTFLTKYWYWYWQYFYKVLLTTLSVSTVNTGVTENVGMENARRSKSDSGKPETDTNYWIQHL